MNPFLIQLTGALVENLELHYTEAIEWIFQINVKK